jgi:hypothetical protein
MPKPLSPEQLAILRAAPMVPTVVNRVRLACALTDTNVRELIAEMPGAPYSRTASIARGRVNNLHLTTARPFAKFFGCTVDDLFPEPTDGNEQTEAA